MQPVRTAINDGLTEFLSGLGPKAHERFDAAMQRRAARLGIGMKPYGAPFGTVRKREGAPENWAEFVTCNNCGGAGQMTADPGHHTSELLACPECTEGRRIEGMAISAAEGGEIGDFEQVTFDRTGPIPGQESVWKWAEDWCAMPQGTVWLYGHPFTGKTHLLKCIANRLRQRMPVVYFDVVTMLDTLRATFDKESDESFQRLWTAVMDAPALCLDDVGKEKGTAWAQERLFVLTNHRIERGLITVMTSNLGQQTLEQMNERLAYRVFESPHSEAIPFNNSPLSREQIKTATAAARGPQQSALPS